MKEIVRVSEPYINPHWLNSFRPVRAFKHNNQVVIDGVALAFIADSSIPDGVEVEIYLGSRDFYAEAVSDIEARRSAYKKDAEEANARAKAEAVQRKNESALFNNSLNIPVKWISGIKDVLSGLTEKSNGDGHNARTVYHVLLEEALSSGRLRRNAGDFLCTSNSGSNGKAWSNQKAEGKKVTCKACLSLAKKWR